MNKEKRKKGWGIGVIQKYCRKYLKEDFPSHPKEFWPIIRTFREITRVRGTKKAEPEIEAKLKQIERRLWNMAIRMSPPEGVPYNVLSDFILYGSWRNYSVMIEAGKRLLRTKDVPIEELIKAVCIIDPVCIIDTKSLDLVMKLWQKLLKAGIDYKDLSEIMKESNALREEARREFLSRNPDGHTLIRYLEILVYGL